MVQIHRKKFNFRFGSKGPGGISTGLFMIQTSVLVDERFSRPYNPILLDLK